MSTFPEAPLSRTDDRRALLLALGAAGVTLAAVLGIVGLPAVNACSADPRGVVTCLRDMADRKFDLPGRIPGQVTDAASADAPAPPPTIVAETRSVGGTGGPLEAPSSAPAETPAKVALPTPAETAGNVVATPNASTGPAPTDAAPFGSRPAPAVAPSSEVTALPGPEAVVTEPVAGGDTALTWGSTPAPRDSGARDETTASPDVIAEALEVTAVEDDAPDNPAMAAQPTATETRDTTEAGPAVTVPPQPIAPPADATPPAPLVLANAEPAIAQPPAPTIAAPVVLAPTIDAIELDGGKSFVSGSGPAGAVMRLYADGRLIGESPVEEGRWLVEGNNLLDGPRRELRVEAIEPDTGKLLGVAAITVEIELPDGGAPPDERPAQAPGLGSTHVPVPRAEPTAPSTTAPVPQPAAPSPSLVDPGFPAVAENQPAAVAPEADPVAPPTLVVEPEPSEPDVPAADLAAAAAELDPWPGRLPPLAAVVPKGESASVEILPPSSLQPPTLQPAETAAEAPSTVVLQSPETPAVLADFDIPAPAPSAARGQPVTILRLLPFGDPEEGRYNVGKAIIRRGDTLWSIARRYYGHGIHYRTIFHANRELIRRPSRIFPGQIFDLPLVTDD